MSATCNFGIYATTKHGIFIFYFVINSHSLYFPRRSPEHLTDTIGGATCRAQLTLALPLAF